MASTTAPWATDSTSAPYGQAPREMRPNWNLMGSRRRVDPPTGQISNILAHEPISNAKDSKDLFSYLSHHGERSNEPVPICDHSRKHFDWQPCEPTDWRIKPRRPRPVPVEHGQGKRMCVLARRGPFPPSNKCDIFYIFPDARNETEEIIKPRRERGPEKPQAPERPQGARHVEPVVHQNVEWGTETKASTHGAFHAEAFPGSIGYDKFPDYNASTGKLIDYCLRENGGPFGRRKLHQNQPLPVAPVASLASIPPRPVTPVQNWHPFTDVKPPPPNQKLKARLEQSALVAASMMAASSRSSSSSAAGAVTGGGGSRPDSVPKFTSQLFSHRGRSEGGSMTGDSTRSAPVFDPKIHMQFNDSNKAPAKMMPDLVPSTNWSSPPPALPALRSPCCTSF